MTDKIIAYRNYEEEFDDSLVGSLINLTFPIAWKAFKGFLVVSAPVLLIGAVVAPAGTNRIEHGAHLVGEQHKFLWGYLGGGIKNTLGVTGKIVGPFINNGSTETNNPSPKAGS